MREIKLYFLNINISKTKYYQIWYNKGDDDTFYPNGGWSKEWYCDCCDKDMIENEKTRVVGFWKQVRWYPDRIICFIIGAAITALYLYLK